MWLVSEIIFKLQCCGYIKAHVAPPSVVLNNIATSTCLAVPPHDTQCRVRQMNSNTTHSTLGYIDITTYTGKNSRGSDFLEVSIDEWLIYF